MRAADAATVRLLERQVYALFQQVPILAVPKGFDVRPHSNFAMEDMDGHGDSPHPKVLTGAFNVQLGPYIVENGRTYAFFDIVIGWITVSLNTASCLDLSRMEAEDAGGEFYWRVPELKRDARGYLIPTPSTTSRGSVEPAVCVLMTHRIEPLLVPVTRERYLQWAVADAKKKLAESEPDAATRAFMAQHKDDFKEQIRMRAELQRYADLTARLLAALTPVERSSAAWVQTDINLIMSLPDHNAFDVNPLAAASTPGAVEIFAYNPKFFDRTLSASAPQLLAIGIARGAPNGAPYPDIGERVSSQLDWRALEALLK